MKHCARLLFGGLAIAVILFTNTSPAFAWGSVDNCLQSGCHSGFRSGSPSVHDVHTSFVNSCLDCHTGSTSNPLSTNSSTNYPDHSCNGCHLVEGLATFHGQETCGCHSGSIGTSEGEDVLPYFYVENRSSIVNPCRLDSSNGGEDWNDDGQGLDNDGDGLYDANDPDCDGIVPNHDETWSMIKALFGDEE